MKLRRLPGQGENSCACRRRCALSAEHQKIMCPSSSTSPLLHRWQIRWSRGTLADPLRPDSTGESCYNNPLEVSTDLFGCPYEPVAVASDAS